MRKFDQLVNWFIPERLRQDTHLYTRTRMVASGTVISWFVCIPIMFLLVILLRGYPVVQVFSVAVTSFGISIWIIALLLLKWTGSFAICIHTLVGTSILSIGIAIAATGGINSPVMVAMVIPPVFAALFTNRQSALVWCVVASLSCIGFYFLDTWGLNYPNLVPDTHMSKLRALFAVFACFLVLSLLYMFEAINAQFQNTLETERQKMSSMAHHDSLTGLANRMKFEKKLDLAIQEAEHQHKKVALIYIDLDDFKPVNDTHGHEVGDQVLKMASQRISQCVRSADTVARLGGDEFAVILDSVDSLERANEIANNISHSISIPMEVYESSVSIGSSCGVSIYPDEAINKLELVNSADQDMYKMKKARKSLPRIKPRNEQSG